MTAMADLEYGPDSSMLVEIVGDVFTGLFGERYAPPVSRRRPPGR